MTIRQPLWLFDFVHSRRASFCGNDFDESSPIKQACHDGLMNQRWSAPTNLSTLWPWALAKRGGGAIPTNMRNMTVATFSGLAF
mmetsp:Transcript_6465/g.14134  ORF Transcript_6465/g.14134 Transcript_6465/m.14134 type:complete len:84 (-) Transcript_6465:381-632(-)